MKDSTNGEAQIVIIDDSMEFAEQLEHRLTDYRCVHEQTGANGVETVKASAPSLVILDLSLPDSDGLAIRKQLKSDPETAHIPILVLTNRRADHARDWTLDLGSDAYLHKDDLDRYLTSHVRMMFERYARPPYNEPRRELVLSLLCFPDRPLVLRLAGKMFGVHAGEKPLQVRAQDYDKIEIPTNDNKWLHVASEYGWRLFQELFKADTLQKAYAAATEMAEVERLNFRVKIGGTRDFLNVPFEFLYEHTAPRGDPYLALRHPISRYVVGTETRRQPLARAFLNDLARDRKPLRVLVIGSGSELAGVEAEIEALRKGLHVWFRPRGISVFEEVIQPKHATYEQVVATLHNTQAHVVHFACHGMHNPDFPADSALRFPLSGARSSTRDLTADHLTELLRRSDVRFVYLGCCHGTDTASTRMLGYSDTLGLADAVIQAQVPGVLSFRIPPDDEEAAIFSTEFYKNLAGSGDLDFALFSTRKKFKRTQPSSLSPVLVVQR